jgi:hypothetical protein
VASLNDENKYQLIALYKLKNKQEGEEKEITDDNINDFIYSRLNDQEAKEYRKILRKIEKECEENPINEDCMFDLLEIEKFFNIKIKRKRNDTAALSYENKFGLIALYKLKNKQELSRQETKIILTNDNFEEYLEENILKNISPEMNIYFNDILNIMNNNYIYYNKISLNKRAYEFYFADNSDIWDQIENIIKRVYSKKYIYSELSQYNLFELYISILVKGITDKFPKSLLPVDSSVRIIYGTEKKIDEKEFASFLISHKVDLNKFHKYDVREFMKCLFFVYKTKGEISIKMLNKRVKSSYFEVFKHMVDDIFKLYDITKDKEMKYNFGEEENKNIDEQINISFNEYWNPANIFHSLIKYVYTEENRQMIVIFRSYIWDIIVVVIREYYPIQYHTNDIKNILCQLYSKYRDKLFNLPEITPIQKLILEDYYNNCDIQNKIRNNAFNVFKSIYSNIFNDLNIEVKEKEKFKFESRGKKIYNYKFENIINYIFQREIWDDIEIEKDKILSLYYAACKYISEFIYQNFKKRYPGDANMEYYIYINMNKYLNMIDGVKKIPPDKLKEFKNELNEQINNKRKKDKRKTEKKIKANEIKLLSSNLPKQVDRRILSEMVDAMTAIIPTGMEEKVKYQYITDFIKTLNNNNVAFISGDKDFIKRFDDIQIAKCCTPDIIFRVSLIIFYQGILNYLFPYIEFDLYNVNDLLQQNANKISEPRIKELYRESGFIFIEETKYRQAVIGQCQSDIDIITMEPLIIENMISIEMTTPDKKKAIHCYDIKNLSKLWEEESGKLFGDCKFDEYENFIPGSCKVFYKFPYPDIIISEEDKNKILKNFDRFTFMKIVPDKEITIGRNIHYVGEASGSRMLYKVLFPKTKYVLKKK